MNKTILIGFFLAFTTGYGQAIKFGEPNATVNACFALQAFARSSSAGLRQDNQSPSASDATDVQPPRNQYLEWWIALALVLLILPLYLLFVIRKGQMMASKIERFRVDVMRLFDLAPCGYQVIDERGVIVQINQTLLQWLGYEKEEVLGKLKFSDVVEGSSIAGEDKTATFLNQKGKEKSALTLVKKSGELLPVIISEMPTVGSTAGNPNRLFSVIDNTDCYQAMERVKTLDQELESFSYSISHDLRAPLRSIDGYSKILHDEYAQQLDEDGKRVLNVVMNNARRMGKLIDGLLDFGRLGRKTIEYTQVNMTNIARTVAQGLSTGTPERNIDVSIGALHPVIADADMMRQVWFSLLENAFKYTAGKTDATIEVASYKIGDGEICYQVKDNGVGFDMQYGHKLFGVFQRLHKVQDFAGTGVGLANVKRIVSRHGGRVWAEATPGEGSIFYFTIPADHGNK